MQTPGTSFGTSVGTVEEVDHFFTKVVNNSNKYKQVSLVDEIKTSMKNSDHKDADIDEDIDYEQLITEQTVPEEDIFLSNITMRNTIPENLESVKLQSICNLIVD